MLFRSVKMSEKHAIQRISIHSEYGHVVQFRNPTLEQ